MLLAQPQKLALCHLSSRLCPREAEEQDEGLAKVAPAQGCDSVLSRVALLYLPLTPS